MAKPSSISLTERQSEFVGHILAGANTTSAAKLCGYSNPAASARQLLSAPAVLYHLEIGLRRKLHGVHVPLAFEVVERILRNEEGQFGERVQLDAAKLVLDRAGFVPLSAPVTAGDKEPEQMSTGELQSLVERLERELGERAEPVNESEDVQAIEIKEE